MAQLAQLAQLKDYLARLIAVSLVETSRRAVSTEPLGFYTDMSAGPISSFAGLFADVDN